MIKCIFCFTFMFLLNSCAKKECVEILDLKIPIEYVINKNKNFKNKNTITLEISKQNINKSIGEFQYDNEESKFVLLISKKINNLSEKRLSSLDNFNVKNISKDPYLPMERWDVGYDRWVLILNEHGNHKWIAFCSIMGLYSSEVCDFSKNLNGYYVEFYLDNENIGLLSEVEAFVSQKLSEWKQGFVD